MPASIADASLVSKESDRDTRVRRLTVVIPTHCYILFADCGEHLQGSPRSSRERCAHLWRDASVVTKGFVVGMKWWQIPAIPTQPRPKSRKRVTRAPSRQFVHDSHGRLSRSDGTSCFLHIFGSTSSISLQVWSSHWAVGMADSTMGPTSPEPQPKKRKLRYPRTSNACNFCRK